MNIAKRRKSIGIQESSSLLGLRERKKNKTRKIIQREALLLFRKQGYDATSIRQIAEAAEVSESTFFRYFPTKEDIVRWDEFDPFIIEAFRAHPAEITTVAALRKAFHEVLTPLSSEERVELHQRIMLGLSVPRVLGSEQLSGPMKSFAEIIAKRAKRKPNDFGVQVLVGAVLGA
jgi:AcrR family transcriptional regulator